MMRVNFLTPVIVISFLIQYSCTQEESASKMPITTDSELALEFYETGMIAFDQLKFELAYHNLEMAIKEDPDFFMAYFWIYFMSGDCPKKLTEDALRADANLNKGETQIKSAFKYMLDGQNDKAVEHLQAAIDLYPNDPHIHKILYTMQYLYLEDFEGALESLNRAIEAVPEYDEAYNLLGYVLMELEEYDRAEEAFDTYIRLSPNIANPYDSKGDYYMNTGQLEKAYDSYMKAFEIDSGFRVSVKKAKKARYLLEKSTEE